MGWLHEDISLQKGESTSLQKVGNDAGLIWNTSMQTMTSFIPKVEVLNVEGARSAGKYKASGYNYEMENGWRALEKNGKSGSEPERQ